MQIAVSAVMLHWVVWWILTDVSEELTTSIIRAI
jgi:hypothetical protein